MYKKLYRSRTDKMLGGVAGGIGEYFEIDPTIIRILFIVALFFGGGGLIAYLVLWIVVPQKPVFFNTSQADQSMNTESTNNSNFMNENSYEKSSNRTSFIGGIILIVLGTLFLMDNFVPRFHFGDFWPLILIGIGIALIINANKNSNVKEVNQ